FDPESPGDDSLDWDGDGMTNLEEFALGTNPRDSSSAITISSANSQSPSFELRFDSVAGRTYVVQANDDFPDGEWQDIGEPLLGTGSSLQQVDADARDSARRIYRIVAAG